MRTLLQVTLSDVATANKAIMDGSLVKIIESVSHKIQPEAGYFYTIDGCRACTMIFDMKDVSEIPQIAESFFMGLNAKVEFIPVMSKEDLHKGIGAWMQAQQQ